jgi:Tfp pilus assembly protein PilV
VLKRQRGHILLDAMIAVFVGAVVLLGTVGAILSGVATAEAARQNNLACHCARQILENIRLRRGAVVADGDYADATTFGPVPQLARLRDGSASVRVLAWSAPVKSVIITVRWRAGQGGGAAKTRVLSALIGPKGVAL